MEVNITYETLFDTLRKERGSEELQALGTNFYDDANNYLTEKHHTFKENNDPQTMQQIMNIKKLLKEIFERRQKKILILAFNQGRTNNELVSNRLLKEEQYFYDSVLETITKYNLLLTKTIMPNGSAQKQEEVKETTKTEEKAVLDAVTVKFLTKLPKFLGKDLESYGPFEEGDTANLPNQLANILIDKKRAEKV